MRDFIRKYGQLIVNWVVFFGIGRWLVVEAVKWYHAGELWNVVNLVFIAQVSTMLVLIVVRRPHLAIDRNIFHQSVPMVAFFSNFGFFWWGAQTNSPALLTLAKIIALFSMAWGISSLLSLGRSFGILIARRDIKTDWLYSVIRHPMFFSDIVFKIALLLRFPYWPNVGILAFGIACYVYRALLEEKFLSESEEYRQYMKQVRYRLLPGVF